MQNLVLLTQRVVRSLVHQGGAVNGNRSDNRSNSELPLDPRVIAASTIDSPSQTLYMVTHDALLIAYSQQQGCVFALPLRKNVSSSSIQQRLSNSGGGGTHGDDHAAPPHTTTTTTTDDAFDDIMQVPDDDDDAVAAADDDAANEANVATDADDSDDAIYLDDDDTVIALTYLNELEALHVATASGRLLLVHVHTRALDMVGHIRGGLSACAWSPDRELCTLLTQSGVLLYMSQEWDVIEEVQIVERGEGSLPGQTLPRVAAAAASASATAATAAAASSSLLYGTLSWRGDGQYVVVSTYHAEYAIRRLRVFDRMGAPQSQSLPVAVAVAAAPSTSTLTSATSPSVLSTDSTGLSSLLAWRPSGNLIASTQRRVVGTTVKHEVVFFERNGLRHGEFVLRHVQAAPTSAPTPASAPATTATTADTTSTSDVSVLDLQWNADSDILALLVYSPALQRYAVQLWTTSNYHWYLKQEITFACSRRRRSTDDNADAAMSSTTTSTDTSTVGNTASDWRTTVAPHMRWDPEQPRKLVIVDSATDEIHWYTYAWDSSVSTSPVRAVAVVDGTSLLVTPLARALVPPPMSRSQVRFPSPVQLLSFPESESFRPNALLSASTAQVWCTTLHGSHASSDTPVAVLTADYTLYIVHHLESARPGSQSVDTLAHHSVPLWRCGFPIDNLRLLEMLPARWSTPTFVCESTSAPSSTSAAPSPPAVVVLAVMASVTGDSLVELVIQPHSPASSQPQPAAPPATSTSPHKNALTADVMTVFHTPLPAGTQVLRMAQHLHHGVVYVQLDDGTVYRYSPATSLAASTSVSFDHPSVGPSLAPLGLAFPTPCPRFGVTSFADSQIALIGRDTRGKLYANQTLLTPQSSSFSLHHPLFLVFTILGAQNAVFFLDLSKTLEHNMSPAMRADPSTVRLIERGAFLITCVPDVERPRAIFELPRGNLEANYPRAFTLASINASLCAHRYLDALLAMRTNRVDLNLIYDHSPIAFLRHAEAFVKQVHKEELIDLFLSTLNENDLTKSTFPQYAPFVESGAEFDTDGAADGDNDRDAALRKLRFGEGVVDDDGEALREDEEGELDGMFDADLADDAASAAARKGKGVGAGGGGGGKGASGGKGPANTRGLPDKLRDVHDKRGIRMLLDRRERERRAALYDMAVPRASLRRKLETSTSKVNLICSHLRDIFLALDASHYLLPILTTYAKRSPPELQAALSLIKTLRAEEQARELGSHASLLASTSTSLTTRLTVIPGAEAAAAAVAAAAVAAAVATSTATSTTSRSSTSISALPTVQSSIPSAGQRENKSATIYRGATGALKYLIFLCDADALFQVALGMYDFDLVMLVAQYTQKDPKEYVPMLSRLSSFASTPNYQRYLVDTELKRWDAALRHLILAVQGGEKDDSMMDTVLQLCKQHDLYDRATELLMPESLPDAAPSPDDKDDKDDKDDSVAAPLRRFFRILHAYAEHLRAHHKTHQAAAAFVLCRRYADAIRVYGEAGDWRAALNLACKLQYDQFEVQALALALADALRVHASRAIDVAHLLIAYGEDVDQAVEVLLSSDQWEESVRVCYANGRDDLLETHVLPELTAAHERNVRHVSAKRVKYMQAVVRLRVIRRAKLLYNAELAGAAGGGDDADAGDHADELDDDLRSIVSLSGGGGGSDSFSDTGSVRSNISGMTSASGISAAGSMLSVASSTSSVFSVHLDEVHEPTADERRIARHAKRMNVKHSKRRIKAGNPHEEKHLMQLLAQTTPTAKHKEQLAALVRCLLSFGMNERARQLQEEARAWFELVALQEATPMPLMPNMSPAQERALTQYWNWPQSSHEAIEPPKPDETFLLPFLLPSRTQRIDTRADYDRYRQQQVDQVVAAASAPIAQGGGGGDADGQSESSSSSSSASVFASPAGQPLLESEDDEGGLLGGALF